MIDTEKVRKIMRRVGHALVRAASQPVATEDGDAIALLTMREAYARTGFDLQATAAALMAAALEFVRRIGIPLEGAIEMCRRGYDTPPVTAARSTEQQPIEYDETGKARYS